MSEQWSSAEIMVACMKGPCLVHAWVFGGLAVHPVHSHSGEQCDDWVVTHIATGRRLNPPGYPSHRSPERAMSVAETLAKNFGWPGIDMETARNTDLKAQCALILRDAGL